MLPGEIDPFADHHIKALEEVNALLALLQQTIDRPTTTNPVTSEEIDVARNKVHNAKNGFVRFKICMADEVKQKRRYEKYAKEHGYKYS